MKFLILQFVFTHLSHILVYPNRSIVKIGPILKQMEVLRKSTRHIPAGKRNFSCPVKTADEGVTPVEAKPFDTIPGPKSLPFIGTLWKYLPLVAKLKMASIVISKTFRAAKIFKWETFPYFICEYKFDRLPDNGLLKLRQYGPLVREDIVPGIPVVWVYTPADIETVYRCEGRYPERRSHLALQKYRQDRPHIYNSGGLLPTNGEEWWRLRSVFQRSLSRVQDVRSHLPVTDTIVQDFLQFAVSPPPVSDFLPKLSRLYLELTCMVAFSARMHSFSAAEQVTSSRSSQLIHAAATTNSCILRTDNGPQLWKFWRTPLYSKLEHALHTLETTAIDLVNRVRKEENKNNTSLVAQYLNCPEVDLKDVYGVAVDLILAGIDTTTYTSCFALYHLATNLAAQELVYEEACQLLPNVSGSLSAAVLGHAAVTRSVVKETLRLNPVSVGVGRILAKDAVLSGYSIPSGTVVVTQNQVTCRLEKYFPRPEEFIPERWMKGSPEYRACSPYLVLPFGHGPRSCIARRLAEQALQVLLLRLVREYKVAWHGGKLGVRSLLINKPDQPVLLSFTKRTHPTLTI